MATPGRSFQAMGKAILIGASGGPGELELIINATGFLHGGGCVPEKGFAARQDLAAVNQGNQPH